MTGDADGDTGADADFDEEAWERELREHRERKDQAFAEERNSPIPPENREGFDSLDYYDPDPDYRVAATVEAHDDPEVVDLDVANGTAQRYHRVATLHFDLGGEEHTLAAYRQADGNAGGRGVTYFLPFRDKTAGQQTYGGGRYLELHAEEELADGDEVTVDFNLAYNPFCAYSDTFACPLPPETNWLETTVEAGERDY